MRARYSPSDQRKVGSTGVASRTGLGTQPGSMGEDGQLREHTSPQNTILRKENNASAVEVENKQYDSIFEASTPTIGYYQKKRPNRTTTPPPPPHLAPKRVIIVAFASRLNCEFEENFGSRAYRARKEWVAHTSEPACRLATKQKVPPTFLMNSTTSSFVYP